MFNNQLLQESYSNMDQQQCLLFLEINKSKSSDSLGKLFIHDKQIEKRPLIIDYEEQAKQETTVRVFRKKIKKQKPKSFCDYKKNICGYITKKIIRQYISTTFLKQAQALCTKYNCSYEESKSYYLSQIQRVTGPSHVPLLFVPQQEKQIPIKQAFREFFQWFLKERYLRYLLLQGKMQNKQAYIEYKNKNLMMIYQMNQCQLDNIKDQENNSDFSIIL